MNAVWSVTGILVLEFWYPRSQAHSSTKQGRSLKRKENISSVLWYDQVASQLTASPNSYHNIETRSHLSNLPWLTKPFHFHCYNSLAQPLTKKYNRMDKLVSHTWLH